jgi:single-stranded-DNA-specific exonuclease
MALSNKRWQIAAPLDAVQYAPFRGINRILATVLYHRGFSRHSEATRFLSGEFTLADPFKMRGVNQTVNRVGEAIRKGELIAVYGDFDADGVTSTALLVNALRAVGARARPYIPHRVDEGYGLNNDALDRIKSGGGSIVITVDCGIRSLNEVRYGQSIGLEMIVTDHHSVGDLIPEAYAVINPKQPGCQYGEDMLAGVGIAYRLADALFRVAAKSRNWKTPEFPVTDLLDLVAIGTVADLAPLDRLENRAMVIEGLKRIRQAPRPGVLALLEVSGTQPEDSAADTIGFRLGPRINAAGRLESALSAYKLLMAKDIHEARPLAEELNQLNVRRQELTAEMQNYAAGLVKEPQSTPLIFAASPNFIQGIVGLVAGRLTEQYYRPSVIIQQGDHESHGSCRSIDIFHITEALDQCSEFLIRHGGHAQAAGFALHNENIPAFQERLTEIARSQLALHELRPTLKIDCETSIHELTEDLYYELARLQPTGAHFSAPLLCVKGFRVSRKQTMGKQSEHLRLQLSDSDAQISGVAFRMGSLMNEIPEWVNVAFRLEINEWNGKREPQLMIEDIQPAG